VRRDAAVAVALMEVMGAWDKAFWSAVNRHSSTGRAALQVAAYWYTKLQVHSYPDRCRFITK